MTRKQHRDLSLPYKPKPRTACKHSIPPPHNSAAPWSLGEGKRREFILSSLMVAGNDLQIGVMCGF